jgi:hypothetical protein
VPRPIPAPLLLKIFATPLLALALAIVPAAAPAATTTTPAAAPPVAAPAPRAAPRAEPRGACGAAGGEVLARTAGEVAQRIYGSELRSSETELDKRQIETYAPLLSAVESGEHAAVEAAVHSLVDSHTHIVRLRVDRGSELLADHGGPYILAPITGTLRVHGETIGHFVFSVQDDLGYVKLVTRFLDTPLVMRTDSGNVPVEGLLTPGPASVPDRGPVRYRGADYVAYSFRAQAYPNGRLRVSLLLAVTRSLKTRSCYEIKADELGLVAQRVSLRFELTPATFGEYLKLVTTLTHAQVYIRSGSHTLAATTHSTPAKLPGSGVLRRHGVDYEVVSFLVPTSVGQARVYVLVAR